MFTRHGTNIFIRVFSTLILCLLMLNCSSADKSQSESAEGLYNQALKLEKDERFDEAITMFQEVKNKHPYSRFATDAELRVADIHFKKEAFIEAQAAYQSFKDLHPRHPRSDYVTFQLAMSYFNQLPPTVDRDISLTTNAILYFDEVINSYPQSSYVKDAKVRREKCIKMEAEKELYIAQFYFKKQQFDSALGRYEALLRKYPKVGLEAKALYGAVFSAFKLKDNEKMGLYLRELRSQFPNSAELKEAERKIKR